MKSLLVGFLSLLFFATLTELSFAQLPFSAGEDRTTIRGTLSGWPDSTCSVELRSEDGGQPVARQMCKQSGFTFVNVPRGEYLVVVQDGIKEAEQSVSAESADTEIAFDLPPSQTQKPTVGDSVSVSELRIPEKAKSLLAKASDEMEQGRVASAEKDIQKTLKISPGYARAVAFEAVVNLTTGNIPAALACADHAVNMDPQLSYAQFVRAMVLNTLGRFSEARNAASLGLRTDERSWQGHFELARALDGSLDSAGALAEATRAEKTAPAGFMPVHMLRTILLMKMNFLDAARQELAGIDKLGIKNPQTTELHKLLAGVSP